MNYNCKLNITNTCEKLIDYCKNHHIDNYINNYCLCLNDTNTYNTFCATEYSLTILSIFIIFIFVSLLFCLVIILCKYVKKINRKRQNINELPVYDDLSPPSYNQIIIYNNQMNPPPYNLQNN